jgi:hypothetical protein
MTIALSILELGVDMDCGKARITVLHGRTSLRSLGLVRTASSDGNIMQEKTVLRTL